MRRTIPGFFIPEQYLLFTFIFHFVHTRLARALPVGARLAREGVIADTPRRFGSRASFAPTGDGVLPDAPRRLGSRASFAPTGDGVLPDAPRRLLREQALLLQGGGVFQELV